MRLCGIGVRHLVCLVEGRCRPALLNARPGEGGNVTAVAHDGAEGLNYALAHAYDVVILDVMLTARDARRDVIHGLDAGADDYLTKPFAFDELLARLRTVGRRGPIPHPVVSSVADLTLDTTAHEAWRGRRRLELTPKEYRLLELLMRRDGRVLSRDAIIGSVWGYESDVKPNTVDAFISSLREREP